MCVLIPNSFYFIILCSFRCNILETIEALKVIFFQDVCSFYCDILDRFEVIRICVRFEMTP